MPTLLKRSGRMAVAGCMLAVSLTILADGPVAALAAGPSDPDWPCIQRKVSRLSIGQMWAGPPAPEDPSAWRSDAAVAALAGRLAARRTTMEEAEALIAEFAQDADDARLTLLFSGAFQLIDRERSRLVDGIGRYARKQTALSEHIDTLRDDVVAIRETAADDDFDALDRLEEMEDRLAWDTRIFDERRQSLTYVCESPVLMERRAFALARVVMSHLSDG